MLNFTIALLLIAVVVIVLLIVPAFVAAHGPGRGNWEYLAFISRMKRDYAAVRGLPGVEVGGPHIEDHADFTAFIVEWAPWDSLPP